MVDRCGGVEHMVQAGVVKSVLTVLLHATMKLKEHLKPSFSKGWFCYSWMRVKFEVKKV